MADLVEFKIVGADQFGVDLRAWRDSKRLAAQRAADQAIDRIVSGTVGAYPVGRTGGLRRGVRAEPATSAMDDDRVFGRARTGARHAHLYEWGTRNRQTTRGWRRGAMRQTVTFVRIAMRERERFADELRDILAQPEPAIGSGTPDVRVTGA